MGSQNVISMGSEALTAIGQIVDAASEWNRVREQEQTARAKIHATEQVLLAEIDAKRDIFLTYLNRSFDEREQNFRSLFASLDAALTDGQDPSVILGAITALAAKSPFQDLRDIDMVRKSLNDTDHTWDV